MQRLHPRAADPGLEMNERAAQEIDFTARRFVAAQQEIPKGAGLFDYSGSGGATFETSSHAAALRENQRVAIGFSFDEAAILASEELGHTAMAFRHVFLDLAARLASDVFDLPHRLVESLPDRHQRVLALGRVAMRLADHDFMMRDSTN